MLKLNNITISWKNNTLVYLFEFDVKTVIKTFVIWMILWGGAGKYNYRMVFPYSVAAQFGSRALSFYEFINKCPFNERFPDNFVTAALMF